MISTGAMPHFEIYKTIHIASIFVFLTATSVTFFMTPGAKGILIGFKIVCGLFGFLIFFTGLGLILSMNIGFPLWAMSKGFLWLLLMVFGAIVAKHFTRFRILAYLLLIFLATVAVFLAVYKPI